MKIILLIIVLFFACGIAMVAMTRLMKTAQRLAELRGEMSKQNALLEAQLEELKTQNQTPRVLSGDTENTNS